MAHRVHLLLLFSANLFSPLGKLAERAIYFTVRNFFFSVFFLLAPKLSQYLLDRFSQSLHHMVGIELQMISPTFFSRYLKGCCHGN